VRECDYCSETIHHELDTVTEERDTLGNTDQMHYHVWCYERVQEAEKEIKTGERVEDLL
jgi:hypothetical protein